MSKEYHDADVLKELYWEDKLSMNEIGEKFGVAGTTIEYWINKHKLGTRSLSESRTVQEMKKPLKVNLNQEGHQIIHDQHGQSRGEDTSYVLLHRLLKAVDTPLDELDGKVVHHRSGIPWDNRPGNLELMGEGEHTSHHERVRREAKFLKKTLS